MYSSKSETSTDARIGSVDAAQMLTTDVLITTTNDTSESMIEPVGGSLTGYAIAAPEVDLFDELSSSSSGSGFISAEHFISSLLREEETSSVTSNDATSTLGDTFEVATSSECESSTTDGSDASTVSVATASQEDAINTRSSSDIDHRHTGFNDSHEVATFDTGTNTFAMTSPERSCRGINAYNDIARKFAKRNIIRNTVEQVSSVEDVNERERDNSSDQQTPSSHSSGSALQAILEMARSGMVSDSDPDFAPPKQSHSHGTIRDGTARNANRHPGDGRWRTYGGVRPKEANIISGIPAMLLGRCRSEPTLRSTAGRLSTTITGVGRSSRSSSSSSSSNISNSSSSSNISSSSSNSYQSSNNSGFSVSRNSRHAYPSESIQTDKGTPNRSTDKLAENGFLHSATTSCESCLVSDSTNSLSEDDNPECLQLTQQADSFDDSAAAYDDWSIKRTWMLTVDKETTGTNSCDSFDVYNGDVDTRQGFRQQDRLATDFKQMLYLLPTMCDSHDSPSFSDLSDTSTTHVAGSSRSMGERSEPCVGSNDNTSGSVDTLVNVSTRNVASTMQSTDNHTKTRDHTCEVIGTANVSSPTSASNGWLGNDDGATVAAIKCVECHNDASITFENDIPFETTTSDDIYPVNITLHQNVSKNVTGTDKDGGNTNRNNPAPDLATTDNSSDYDSSNIDTDMERAKKRSKKQERTDARVTAVSDDGALKTQGPHSNSTPEETPHRKHSHRSSKHRSSKHRSSKSESRRTRKTEDVLPEEQSAYVVARYNQDMFSPVGPADTQVLLPRPSHDEEALLERGEVRQQRGYYR